MKRERRNPEEMVRDWLYECAVESVLDAASGPLTEAELIRQVEEWLGRKQEGNSVH